MLMLPFRGLEGNDLGIECSNSCRQLLLLENSKTAENCDDSTHTLEVPTTGLFIKLNMP